MKAHPNCPFPRLRPTASISSMKTMHGAFLRASLNRSRTRPGPTPTNISMKSDPVRIFSVGGIIVGEENITPTAFLKALREFSPGMRRKGEVGCRLGAGERLDGRGGARNHHTTTS